MSDLKSKLPDLKELGQMTGKLFGDLKNSVMEIYEDYKQKRANETTETKAEATPEKKSAEVAASEATPKKTATNKAESETTAKPTEEKK